MTDPRVSFVFFLRGDGVLEQDKTWRSATRKCGARTRRPSSCFAPSPSNGSSAAAGKMPTAIMATKIEDMGVIGEEDENEHDAADEEEADAAYLVPAAGADDATRPSRDLCDRLCSEGVQKGVQNAGHGGQERHHLDQVFAPAQRLLAHGGPAVENLRPGPGDRDLATAGPSPSRPSGTHRAAPAWACSPTPLLVQLFPVRVLAAMALASTPPPSCCPEGELRVRMRARVRVRVSPCW